MELKKIPPVMAAEMMGKAPSFVYIGLQRGLLPIGTAVKKGQGRGARYNYYISPKLFMEYTGFTTKQILEVAAERGFCCC